MKQIGLALVGGGFIARAHAAAWRVLSLFFPELPQLRRLVVCEVDEERARSAASRLDFEEWEIGWEKTVRRTDVDLVAIATPPDLHRDVALAAIGAGKHVFCEKPLARFAAEAEEMCRAAEKAGVVNVVGFNLRRAPAIQQAAKMARDGSLGEVLHVSGRYFQDHGRDPSRPSSWRYDSARAGSGAVGDLGSHLLDLAIALAGEITAVVSVARTVYGERGKGERAARSDVDDCAAWLARFESGSTGAFEVSRLAAGRRNQLAIEVNGRNGSIAFDWERCNELRYFSADDSSDRQGFRTILAGPANPGYIAPIPIAGIGVGFLETMVAQAADLVRTIALPPLPGGARGVSPRLALAPAATEGRASRRERPAEGRGAPPPLPTGEGRGEGRTPAPLPTFRDGWRNCQLIDAILESSRTGAWFEVPPAPEGRER